MRLDAVTSKELPAAIARQRYERTHEKRGIVHFGIGAFMRAHQAAYTDDAMNAGDSGWMTTGVSLRSASVRDQLAPQDGLYLIAEQSSEPARYRLIGSVREVLVAPEAPRDVIAALADPDTRVVTITVTEKGYCRDGDGNLDFASEGIAHDITSEHAPRTLYGFLAAGLARRRSAGGGGLSLVSCDNLAANGEVLHALLAQFLTRRDPALADWFEAACTCPSTMVDRIVPATTEANRKAAEEATGLRDEGLVVTEPFRQWVIEDRFANRRPRWEAGGAQFVSNVAPFETAKLRMLNGAHSALAYLGLERGHEFVHQAIGDPAVRPLVERLMLREAAPTIEVAPGQDLSAYAAALLARFENPALRHRLVQIAMDGSQKIPQRWLATLAEHQQRGESCPSILTALAAWMRHIRGDNCPVDDPMADALQSAWNGAGRDGITEALFAGPNPLLTSNWYPTDEDRTFLVQALGRASSIG